MNRSLVRNRRVIPVVIHSDTCSDTGGGIPGGFAIVPQMEEMCSIFCLMIGQIVLAKNQEIDCACGANINKNAFGASIISLHCNMFAEPSLVFFLATATTRPEGSRHAGPFVGLSTRWSVCFLTLPVFLLYDN